ncbi:MAG: PH domain-containing protein [Micrococcaceae bacterium]
MEHEFFVLKTRPHGRKLTFPAIMLAVITGGTMYLRGVVPEFDYREWLLWLIYGAAVICLYFFCLAPYLRWLSVSYQLTSKRVIIRKGAANRKEIDAPLSRVQSIEISRNIFQRIYGRAGDLIIHFKDKRPSLRMKNVPEVDRFRQIMWTLITTNQEAQVPNYETSF